MGNFLKCKLFVNDSWSLMCERPIQLQKGMACMMKDLEEYQEELRRQRGYTESFLSAMKRRLNLQSIGTYIRSGDIRACVNYDSFQERQTNAYTKLERYLTQKYGEDEADDIITQVDEYSCVTEEVSFSLGMKAGATLYSKLTDNFETDI